MRRPWIQAALLISLVLVGAAPTLAVTAGRFEGPPGGSNTATGAVPLTGWVVDDAGVRRVIIQVDGVDIGEANYGRPRGDVAAQVPGFPNSSAAGFSYILNSTPFTNEIHTVTAKAEMLDGTFRTLSPARDLLFNNNTHNLHPFGRIDRPNRNADLYGNCEAGGPRYSVISGWALDLGVEIGDAGLGYVELLLDGVQIANTRTDCFYSDALGGFTNCYGLRRLDIEHHYPFALDAPTAGFRFVIDVGALYQLGVVSGHHTLTIRAGDISNQVANVDELPVQFRCADQLGNEDSFGRVLVPRPNRFWTGLMRFEGWALDVDGIRRIELYVDGRFIRNAVFGVTTNSEVAADYPGFPDSAAPVWRAFYDSNNFVDGVHQVEVFAIDDLGASTLIGESSFVVANDFDD